MAEYLLTIRIPVKAMDDPEARAKANLILADAEPIMKNSTGQIDPEVVAKLQKLETRKGPDRSGTGSLTEFFMVMVVQPG